MYVTYKISIYLKRYFFTKNQFLINISLKIENTQQYNINNFPEQIKMSGLPFMWQGWNTKFELSDEICENCPVYRLYPYTLYGHKILL